MSRVGVQTTDVWEAADQVLMSGQRPTIERVRQQLGRGSPNTVGPHLDVWYQQLGQRLQGLNTQEGGGTTVPAALQALTAELWRTAQQEAGQVVELKNQQIEAALVEQAHALEQKKQETAYQQQQLTLREADLNAHITLLQEQLKLADQRLDESLRTQTEKEVQLEALRRNNAEISQKKQVLDTEIQRLRDEHEAALRQQSREHHGQVTRWMAEVDRARQEKKQLETESAQALLAINQDFEQKERRHELAQHALEKQVATALDSAEQHQQQWREALDLNQQQQLELEQLQDRINSLNQQRVAYNDWLGQFTHTLTLNLASHREPKEEGDQSSSKVSEKNTTPPHSD